MRAETMVISHKHKYLFIQIPQTASSAIAKELCEIYNGSHILRKHSHYFEFEQQASPDEKKYFAFAGIRNPLDTTVSVYYKFLTNHRQKFTNPKRLVTHSDGISTGNLKKFHFVVENKMEIVR